MPWYLEQFAAHDTEVGHRTLDYLDLHYFPAGDYASPTDATRSLWDPTYTDPSWIDDTIELIPRMNAWTQGSYPGTKTSLSEYDFGYLTDDARVQNVVEADALGIFGREGLDLACFDGDPGAASSALTMFLDYDGQGHGFGDRGVKATSAAQGTMSVFAARRGKTGPLTIIVVNKATTPLRSSLGIARDAKAGTAKVWQYAGGPVARAGTVTVSRKGSFAHTYPGSSITLVQVPLTR